MTAVIVLIPAYEPTERLPDLVDDLRLARADLEIVVVDDGSGSAYADVFDRATSAGATVLHHERNLGKGAALKTGFAHLEPRADAPSIVTADADGQHTVHDILAVADEVSASRESEMVLGCRSFDSADVPLRSRVGNAISRYLFSAAAGFTVSDTQTGLRGFPHAMLSWLRTLPGERFEYEQNMLLRARRAGWNTTEVPIETVYLDHNSSSHFRPVRDSALVLWPVLLFACSSFVGFLIDTAFVVLLTALTGMLVPAIIGARVISATANFAINRRFVFQQRDPNRLHAQVIRYGLLAVALLVSNIVWMTALVSWGVPLLVAKITTEIVLFITSYGTQKALVFAPIREQTHIHNPQKHET